MTALEPTPGTRVADLIARYPFLLEFLAAYAPEFQKLKNPILRNTVGRVATLQMAASMGNVPVEKLVADLAAAIRAHESQRERVDGGAEPRRVRLPVMGAAADEGCAVPGAAPSGDPELRRERREALKGMIRDLHDGVPLVDVQVRFAERLGDADPGEIAAMEQELVNEGMPPAEIRRLCDVHVAVFKQSLLRQNAAEIEAPADHPVQLFRAENRELAEAARAVLGAAPGPALEAALERLAMLDRHYLRKELQLFPCLERHGVTGPPQVMWAVHDEVRAKLARARAAATARDAAAETKAREVAAAVEDMIFKEENILFPLSLGVLDAEDWARVARDDGELGGPAPEYAAAEPPPAIAGLLGLDTGALSLEQVNLLLRALPVDITFVDENDEVRYYSKGAERVFPRTPGIIGRKVQNCHPPKSLDVVSRILDGFRAGERESAEFWIQLHGRFVHIRYLALRDAERRYRGCLEVTQEVTEIRALEGERRLLDWA